MYGGSVVFISTNPSPFRFLLCSPIPFIPFPMGRGISFIREAKPLFDSPLKNIPYSNRVSKRGEAPLPYPSPFPFKERGRG